MKTRAKTGRTDQIGETGDLQFTDELAMIFERMMGEIMLTPEDEPPAVFSKMTHSQRRTFLYIALRGAQRMSEIARMLGVSLPSATSVVDGLVKARLMRRRHSTDDRRVIFVELTAAGMRHHEKMTEHHAGKVSQAFSHLSPPQQLEVLEHLRRVVALLPQNETPPRD